MLQPWVDMAVAVLGKGKNEIPWHLSLWMCVMRSSKEQWIGWTLATFSSFGPRHGRGREDCDQRYRVPLYLVS